MRETRQDASLPLRQLLAAVLAALLIVLAVLYLTAPGESTPHGEGKRVVSQGVGEIDAVIDTMFERHGILPQWVRTWRVHVPGTPFFRIERRIWVPREFVVVRFNHELVQELSDYGARVVGLERTSHGTVTLHVLRDGVVVESLSFVPKPELERGS